MKCFAIFQSLCCILLILLFSVLSGSTGLAADQSGEKEAVDKPVPAKTKITDKDRQPSLAWGNELYQHYCIPCHGINGDGHGFNAPHLLVKPANHTDSVFMSKRSDQKLFDTINLGGVEVAKSTLMPPWGAALDNDNKIKSLILKLRALCQCQATKNW
ncbi:MAG TPA: cytochrome c [Desulfobulbaceae bacterium]|nr:cytochrome c [Desulfobulbaceae bacterium]